MIPAHDAQPSTIDHAVIQQLRRDADTLGALAEVLQASRPDRALRSIWAQSLSGVIAHCEALRMALK